jgi:hypothetical protein
MAIYEHVDGATEEVMRAFWTAVSIVTEQAQVTEADALMHMRRSVADRLKAAKPAHAVDYQPDGRSALWRVRMTIWRGVQLDTLYADTDEGKPLEYAGATLIQGLPAVALWAWELIGAAHPGRTISDLDQASVLHKLRSLRVALSNQDGACIWRLRYVVEPEAAPATGQPARGSLRGVGQGARGPEYHMAHIRVTREAEAPRQVRKVA